MKKTQLIKPAPSPDALDLIEPKDSMRVAYAHVLRRLATCPVERLEPVNVDVPKLATMVLGAVPKIMRHRGLLAQLVTFDIAHVDELEQYALALGYAHAMRRAADLSPLDVRELVGSLRATRRQLSIDARALASRGLIDGKRLARLKGGSGYLAVALDVVGLVQLMLENWAAIAGKTGTSAAELRRARADANRLVLAVGRRGQLERMDDPDEQLYRQFYSLLVRAYSEVRAALCFVRRAQGDANKIAPSAYPGRAKRSKKKRAAGVNSAASRSSPSREVRD